MDAPKLRPDPEHVADACIAAAKVNHYLVGLLGPVSYELASATLQILIARENAGVIDEDTASLAIFVLSRTYGSDVERL